MGANNSVKLVCLMIFCISLSTEESVTSNLDTDSEKVVNDFDLSNSPLIHGNGPLGQQRYKEKMRIVHQLLKRECPASLLRERREILSSQVTNVHDELDRLLFERMVRMLVRCRQVNKSIFTATGITHINKITSTTTPTLTSKPTKATPLTTTTLTTTMLTTTKPTTTTTQATTTTPTPSECITATNLTEYWRKDHTGQKVGGDTNCDTRDMKSSGRPWFRFSGAAGTQLLNTCPPDYSCGAQAGMWSDEAMPSSVGQSIDITVYGSIRNCKEYPKPASVMRCSLKPGDFVYKYNGEDLCNLGFCGMD